MKIFALTMAALCALAPAAYAAAPDLQNDIVGTILEVEGQATIATAGAPTPMPARINMPVHPRDILNTAAGSRLFLQLIDNTELTMGENGQMTIDDYAFNDKDDTKNHAVYSVVRGAFLFVDGLLGKKENPDVRVNIPSGSIGIRGTKFWGGELDGSYGVIVGEGKVEVHTARGTAALVRGQGTIIANRDAAPTPPAAWAPEQIKIVTATIALKSPEMVGQRMKENVKRNEILRASHDQSLKLREEATQPVIDPTATPEGATDDKTGTKKRDTDKTKTKETTTPVETTPADTKTETPSGTTTTVTTPVTKSDVTTPTTTGNPVTTTTTTVTTPTDTTVRSGTKLEVTEPATAPVRTDTVTIKNTSGSVSTGVESVKSTTSKTLNAVKEKE